MDNSSGKLYPVILLQVILAAAVSCASLPGDNYKSTEPTSQSVQSYKFTVVNAYPHDRNASTQGLAFENGVLYEGTGQYGESSLRRVDLKTGEVLQVHNLPLEHYGEGITIFGDNIIQLTWQSHKGFVHNKDSFEVLRDFPYDTEGWGITTDGKRLIMSDGSSTLYFLEPDTLKVTYQIQVYDNDKAISRLNELEYIDGKIYANIWLTDDIAIINPGNGRVTGWIDLTGLLPPQSDGNPVGVLNGIAYDNKKSRLFVTGKLWPKLFEIKLVPK